LILKKPKGVQCGILYIRHIDKNRKGDLYMNNNANLLTLYSLLSQIELYKHTIEVLNYDMETAVPPKGMIDDADGISFFSAKIFEIEKSADYIDAVTSLYQNDLATLDEYNKRLVTLLYRNIEKDKKVTPELHQEMTKLFNEAYITWIDAKAKNSYPIFKNTLKNIADIEKKRISLRDNYNPQKPYDSLFSDYEEGFDSEDLDQFFDELEKGIVPLVKKIKNSNYTPRHDFLHRPVSISKQERFSKELLKFNGFDFERGSLSTTEHPFTAQLSYNDTRVTTHYYETNFISNMYSIIHEGGHALFGQNIPEEVFTKHLGEGSLSMAKHESVSRFYENVIGRSKEYIHAIYPLFKEIFSEEFSDVSEQDLYEGVNYVDLNNSIRTEADELTYSLHIIIRYRLEKKILEGKADIEHLDQEWNLLTKEILDIDNIDASTGILQDVHWTSGFGYFPTYALGNALNCIYVKRMCKEIDFNKVVSEGKMNIILNWMKENVFKKASLLDTKEWIENISGESFSAKDYIDYLTAKFSEIYHLN
jgi:hypothetical protein